MNNQFQGDLTSSGLSEAADGASQEGSWSKNSASAVDAGAVTHLRHHPRRHPFHPPNPHATSIVYAFALPTTERWESPPPRHLPPCSTTPHAAPSTFPLPPWRLDASGPSDLNTLWVDGLGPTRSYPEHASCGACRQQPASPPPRAVFVTRQKMLRPAVLLSLVTLTSVKQPPLRHVKRCSEILKYYQGTRHCSDFIHVRFHNR